ncbi:MAG: hypothetical protein KDI31_01530, partial [Pseudomonadales bacterium]|nr:hypothetical protein [Pseudomonadales bacterium]
RGAKLKDPKRKGRLIADASGLLTWPADDRAVASFATMTEIESARAALRKIITTWLAATSV